MRIALVAVAVALATAACSSSASSPPGATRVAPAEAAQLLIDRNWIDRLPETHSDRLHVYRFVPSMGGGVYQDRTLFKGSFELFTFEATADEIRIKTPEDGGAHRTRFHIDRITDGPEGTDLRLTLDDPPRGPRVYLGWSRETDTTGAALEVRLADERR
jgi:hypothetical protein